MSKFPFWRREIPVYLDGIHLDPSEELRNLELWDYDETHEKCRSELKGKTVIRFTSVKDCSISPRRYYILETLRRVVAKNPKYVEFISLSNPLLAEALAGLPETMSSYLKERIPDLAEKVVYQKL